MRNSGGFTLIELIVVIVVIAVLAAISTVAYTGIQERAQTTAMNAAAEQWSDAVEVQLLVKKPSRSMNNGYGRKGCAGTSAGDFPAANGFGAGRCIDYSDIPGFTDANADTYNWLGEEYDDRIFTEESWWATKRGAFNGAITPNTLLLSNGAKIRWRGLQVMIEPSANGFWGHPDRIRVRWATTANEECVKGTDATVAYFNQIKSLYTAQFPSSVTIVSGRVCDRIIEY